MEQTLASALIGGVTVLIGKIVWDWLTGKKRGGEDEAKHAGDCARLVTLEKQFHNAHLSLAQDVTALKGDVAVIRTDIGYIKRKLDLNGNGKS